MATMGTTKLVKIFMMTMLIISTVIIIYSFHHLSSSGIVGMVATTNSSMEQDLKHRVKERNSSSRLSENSSNLLESSRTRNKRITKRNICPHTVHLFKDRNAILDAYHNAEIFHNRAGNLKAIENYLNDQMDETLKSLGYRFIPDNDKDPLPMEQNIPEYIINTLKATDTYKRGGYDKRSLPGHYSPEPERHKRPFAGIRMSNNWRFDVTESVQWHERWKVGMGPIEWHLCKSIGTISAPTTKLSYEDKWMCSFDELKEQKMKGQQNGEVDEYESSSSCNVISIGSNGQWEFEEVIVSETQCQTHTFDCTMSDPKKPDHDSMHFYPYCVDKENKKIGDREYITYAKLIEKAGLKQPPNLFKIDVEGFEYDFLVQMLNEAYTSSSTIELPSQIAIELHYNTRMYDLPWMPRSREAAEISMFSAFMYNVGGYIPVAVKYVKGCDACVEVLYARVFCDGEL